MNKPLHGLYLIPTPVGKGNPRDILPSDTLNIIYNIRHFLVENVRTARRFLRDAGYTTDFNEVCFFEINEHNQDEVTKEWLSPLFEGHSMGLMSEAGIPCVADPGSVIVRLSHELSISVFPLSGTSSIFKALMASGLNGQKFTFHGYLPVKTDELKLKLKKIEEQMAQNSYTQIFIETPYRNERLYETMLTYLKDNTMLCIASNIDTPDMKILTKPISQWKKQRQPSLKNIPTVFLLGQ